MVLALEFHRYEKVSHYDAGVAIVNVGDWVVARTARGPQIGRVVETRPRKEGEDPFPAVEREATRQDLQKHYSHRLRSEEALVVARERAAEHQLNMQFLSAELTLDSDRLIYYFHADSRVDFRILLKDLASAFHKRIELIQINARDRAKVLGGLGPCGRICCCSSWLREFTPVSVKLAKDQGASLNPHKISGSCGRLMCCLRYEYETYRALRKELPAIGSSITTPEGVAQVLEVRPLTRTLLVALPGQSPFEIHVGPPVEKRQPACGSCSQTHSVEAQQ